MSVVEPEIMEAFASGIQAALSEDYVRLARAFKDTGFVTDPVQYKEMEYFHCDLTGGMNALSFSTADDPFCKASVGKFYPECVVINREGEILAKVNH